MISRTFRTTIVRNESMCFIPLTFDPKPVFGKVRAPIKVTVNGYTYRSTIAAMGGPPCIPLRRSHREAAGLAGGEYVEAIEGARKPETRARRIAAATNVLQQPAGPRT